MNSEQQIMKYATYEEWKNIGFQVLDINDTDAYDEIMEESMGGGFNDDWSGW